MTGEAKGDTRDGGLEPVERLSSSHSSRMVFRLLGCFSLFD